MKNLHLEIKGNAIPWDLLQEVIKKLTREIAKIVKIDLGYTGVKIDFVQGKTANVEAKTL